MLSVCEHCYQVLPEDRACPHCRSAARPNGTGFALPSSIAKATALLGLALTSCVQAQPLYGTAVEDRDDDGDGISLFMGDCDDDDDTIYPGAEETPGDGIDSNCDGKDDPIT